jgi:DNA polymerase/3'-5' exonuclease PolX
MKKLFENAISNIEELMQLRSKQLALLTQLERSKEASPISFKLKYYKIWINLLKDCIKKNVEIKIKDDINALKLTKSLEQNLVELFETGEIKDVEDTRNEIQNLEKQLKKTDGDSASLFNSMNSAMDDNDNDEPNSTIITKPVNKPLTKPIIEKKKINKDGKDSKDSKDGKDGVIDTSKIEAQPKILADETRPTDARGGAIFDMRYFYGVGPKNAEKLVDGGLTLEKLLEDWAEWIKKNPDNAILMISKLPVPSGYNKQQWEALNEDKQRSLQMGILNTKLNNETKYLYKLNSHQLLGIKYFHDMSQKIPREEVQKGERILKAAAKHMNKDIVLTLCGSYRRGRAKSGDVDCLITHPDIKTMEDLETNPVNVLAKFVELLTNLDFLVDHLTDFGRSKYMGFCIIKQAGKKTNTARRIDIRFIPFDSYGASILYFTGSKTFNTQMRTHALSKGYSLNEYGLKRLADNVLIACKTEEEVFEILKYPYKKPEERDI